MKKFTKQVTINDLKKSQLNADKILLDFINENNAADLVNAYAVNRGDMFEMCITQQKVLRDGLHKTSQGDFIFNDKVVEIKYLTKKTKASKELHGTTATHYLIGFNSGYGIQLRLIALNEIVYSNDGKERIKYQDNCNKGIRVYL